MKINSLKSIYLTLAIMLMLVSFFIDLNKEIFLLLGLLIAMLRLFFDYFSSAKVIIFSTILVASAIAVNQFESKVLYGAFFLIVGIIAVLLIIYRINGTGINTEEKK